MSNIIHNIDTVTIFKICVSLLKLVSAVLHFFTKL